MPEWYGAFLILRKPEADAADVAAAFFELGNIWSETNEATFFELGLKFWSMIGHDDMFAGADEVVGEAFSAFVVVDDDFIDVCESVDFLLGFFVKSITAVCDSMFIDNRDGKVDIVPEAICMISEWVNMLSAVVV